MEDEATVETSIDKKDYRVLAEAIYEEYKARKSRRESLKLDKQWDEIDRQIRMEPENSHKLDARGQIDSRRAWMPEVELPLQAGALETLLSDVRRLRYPSSPREWFMARAALTKDYFESFAAAGAPYIGESNERFKDKISQDDADVLIKGYVSNFHSSYDFRGNVDLCDAQALCYGTGVGRIRRVRTARNLSFNARMQPKDKQSPVLVPRDIRHVYFDDSKHALMHEGYALGPSIIQDRTMKLVDLKAASLADSEGYLDAELSKLKPDKSGNVTLLELEGDFAFDRSTSETVIVQDVCLYVAFGTGDPALVRIEQGEKFSTFIVFKYHLEGPQFANASSPLLKGMPVAKIAAQMMNRVIESAQLKNQPPVRYSPDDANLAAEGGPGLYPGSSFKSVEGVDVMTEIGGDPAVLMNAFITMLHLYADVTGVTPARLGAETKSHTTAFAKNVEVNRGQTRTVDYVNATLAGQMTRLLEIEYRMGLDMLGRSKKAETIYLQEWQEFVELKKGHLADIVRFEAIGSDAPEDQQQAIVQKLQSAQAALQLDATATQLGQKPTIQTVRPMIEEILRDGGWHSIEDFFIQAQPALGPAADGTAPGLLSAQPGLVNAGV